jgi:hypothetical protein
MGKKVLLGGYMAKIDRVKNLAAFAGAAQANERTIFGMTSQADDLDSQITPEWLRGWGIVGPNDAPTMQDFNALGYTLSQLLAYLHQMGVAEWDDGQEYYTGAVCVHAGKVWQATQDNVGEQPADGSPYWVRVGIAPRTTDITVTVGAGGDYPTINAALEDLSAKYYPAYIAGGFTATVQLLSGFVMAEQVVVKGVDLGWITITAIDPVTTIDTAGLVDDYPVGTGVKAAFSGLSGAVLPNIGVLFAMGAAGADDYPGILLYEHARATVLPGAGVQNAKSNGLIIVNGSSAIADNAIFSGAAGHGISLDNGRVQAVRVDCSNAGQNGIQAEGRSTVQASEANCSNAGEVGIYADGASTIEAYKATCSNCAKWGVLAKGASTINCPEVDARNSGEPGVTGGVGVSGGSTVNAQGADCSGAGGDGMLVLGGSTVNAQGATCSGAGGYGIVVFGGSTVNAQGADCSGAVVDGIVVSGGSTANAQGADCSGAGGDGMVVEGGSTVNAQGATGTTSETPNTLTANGIIFR